MLLGGILAAPHVGRHRHPVVVPASPAVERPATPRPAPTEVSRDLPRRPLRSTPSPVAKQTAKQERSSVELDVTAYCATGSRNAAGEWPTVGTAAGNRWPLGTRIDVPGVGVVTIADRIGWGSDLDLYLGAGPGCERAASSFGRRRLAVTVLP